MEEKLVQAQDILLAKINQICGKFGLNNIMAQLYAVLYMNNKVMSLNEMVERLKISKGSVSTNIRALERYGAVRQIWVKGSRKDYYEAEVDIAKVIFERMRSMAQNRLNELGDMLESSYQVLKSIEGPDRQSKEDVKVFAQRLEKLKKLHAKAESMFKLFNSKFVQGMF